MIFFLFDTSQDLHISSDTFVNVDDKNERIDPMVGVDEKGETGNKRNYISIARLHHSMFVCAYSTNAEPPSTIARALRKSKKNRKIMEIKTKLRAIHLHARNDKRI